MVILDSHSIASIGCSCINQFQIEFFFEEKPIVKEFAGSVFDWNVVTPQSTLDFFHYVNSGDIKQVMCDSRNYCVEGGRLKNTVFEGFYFWHENVSAFAEDESVRQDFLSKVSHLVDNLLSLQGKANSIFLWSNLQPNLKIATYSRPFPWETFRLTQDRYEKITEAVAATFHKDARVLFTTRSEDVDNNVMALRDVITFYLGRGMDFSGPPTLYDGIFEVILAAAP